MVYLRQQKTRKSDTKEEAHGRKISRPSLGEKSKGAY